MDKLHLEPLNPVMVYLERLEFALLLAEQVFTNETGSTGILYLVTSDTTLKKSPTQTMTTQTNQFFAALCGFLKLELLKCDIKLNLFALRSKLYLRAIHSAYAALRELNPNQLAA